MRPVPGADMEYAIATLVGMQDDLSKASSVLIIGAGPVGIEVAGVSQSPPPSLKEGRGEDTEDELGDPSTIRQTSNHNRP